MRGDDLDSFARLAEALRPWLPHLVIVGGWSHRLHRLHSWATRSEHAPLVTKDADIAFEARARLGGDIGAALKSAGFEEALIGEHRPPIAEYRLGDASDGFYAEFLTPLRGSGVRRGGASDATMVSAGVTAQKLRHLDALLTQPWTIRLDATAGFPVHRPIDVRIANPVSFIVQKLLIRNMRPPRKQAQDVLYIHDTLELFGAHLAELGDLWVGIIRPTLAPNVARSAEQLGRDQFARVDDVIRNAARIPSDRSLAPERIRADCASGLEVIFSIA